MRPLFVSTYPPEECGLATFTKDTADAVDLAAHEQVSSIIAIRKIAEPAGINSRVVHVIDNSHQDAYHLAAEVANASACSLVSLQHEFGLYPDSWGKRIMDFVNACDKPIVTTFHTLLQDPEPLPRQLVRELAGRSNASIVMTKIAAKLLVDIYDVEPERIHVIPHGVPSVPFARDNSYRQKLSLENKKVICTFGLINSGKGLEQMIRAMPAVVATCPNAIYLIVGATHPLVKQREGEAYRQGMIGLADSLGMSQHVRFVNRYLTLDELLCHLQSCDVFVTPYPGKDQIASGTMAYAMATVGAIVSTPFLYAEEVLANERGLLVPFGDSNAMAHATIRLLSNPDLLQSIRKQAYVYARAMFWPCVGKAYLKLFRQVVNETETNPVSSIQALQLKWSATTSASRFQEDI